MVLREITPSGKITEYQYDAMNRLKYKIAPSGKKLSIDYTIYTIDTKNSKTQINDSGYREYIEYDVMGREIATYDNGNPDDLSTLRVLSSKSYNQFGEIGSEKDQFDNEITYLYDSIGKKN